MAKEDNTSTVSEVVNCKPNTSQVADVDEENNIIYEEMEMACDDMGGRNSEPET